MKSKLTVAAALVVALAVVAWFVAPEAEGVRSPWPAKKGEVCWQTLDEGDLVRAYVTNVGEDHYILHGGVYPSEGGEVEPFGGNAEIDGDTIVALVTKVQINEQGTPDEVVEAYTGILRLDVVTLDGSSEGINSRCARSPVPNTDCELFNAGGAELVRVPCP